VTLQEALEAVAAGLDPAPDVVVLPDGSIEWARDGIVFAALEATGDVVAFRLDEVLAAAAQKTPDTAPTPRGNPWVVFAPGVLDEHAIDRAQAWFEAAYRRAVPG
jgi:hypothetical protein